MFEKMTRELFELSMEATKTQANVSFDMSKTRKEKWVHVWIIDDGDGEKDFDGNYSLHDTMTQEEKEAVFQEAKEHLERLIRMEKNHGQNDQEES